MTTVVAAAFSDIGRVRRRNEDHFLVQRRVDNTGPWEIRVDLNEPEHDSVWLCAVADGLGGHAGGAEASRTALEALWRELLGSAASIDDLAAAVRRAVLSAGDAVRQAAAAQKGLRDMGTTVVGIAIRGDELCGFNVGDSRLYRLRDGAMKQVSLDHTVAGELERLGKLTPEQAQHVEQRHVITNCLGGPPGVDAYVDIFPERPLSGDRLLLCSDGVSGALDLAELESTCKRDVSPITVVQSLVEAANERGGVDNSTAVVVDLR
jgi:protein phosphatase